MKERIVIGPARLLMVPGLLGLGLLAAGCGQGAPAEQAATAVQPKAEVVATLAGKAAAGAPPIEKGSPVATPDFSQIEATDELIVQDLAEGNGPAVQAGQTAVVHYTGWLTDGTKFDSSLDQGQPFAFPVGAAKVIPGWDQGVQGMKVGGKRRLIIPSELAYGSRGVGPIPPDSTLVFDVELVGIR